MDTCVYIDEDLVICDMPAASKEEAIRTLGGLMTEKKLVKEGFSDAVLAREEKYPTGLELPIDINIAIAHTDPEYVYEPSLAVGVLRNPVMFCRMDDPAVEIPVKIVFLVAVAEAHAHLDVLQKIVGMCQDFDLMTRISQEKSSKAVYSYVRDKLIGA